MSSLYELIKGELTEMGVICTPNIVERYCASVGAHILNAYNLEHKKWFEAGAPTNFRVHICAMIPSGFGKSMMMGQFLNPRYGFLSRTDISSTMSTTFTQESWVGTAVRNTDTNEWEATEGVLVRYGKGIVGADEFARLKAMMESRGEEHDVSYLLSALDKDYAEKQHSGKTLTINDIGMTFWCGLRPVQMNIADSGLARRFSFQTFYPTIADMVDFKKACRKKNMAKAISEDTKMAINEKVIEIRKRLDTIKEFDLQEVHRFLDSNPMIPHFEEQIYTRVALGFAIATDCYPKLRMFKEMTTLLEDEWKNRQHIRVNPEIEMVYAVIAQQNNKANKELIIQFLHNSYQLSKAKILSLIGSLKQMGRIVEHDGYLITSDKAKFSNVYEVVKFD